MRWILFLAISLCPAFAAEPEIRTWTDINQQRVEAAFESVSDDAVALRTAEGSQIMVPLANLSSEDRAWVAAHVGGESEADAGAAADTPGALSDWPRIVAMSQMPTVTVVREDKDAREFVYETEHYEFVCDSMLSANVVREFSRLFEATWLANSLLPLDLKPEPEPGREKFLARIFTSKADYDKIAETPGTAGIYSRADKAMMMPLDSLGVRIAGNRVTMVPQAKDYSTLVHESTHQLMNHWLHRLPLWLVEGSAQYLELAEYQTGKLSFVRKEQRLKETLRAVAGRGRFSMLPLSKLLVIDSPAWHAAFSHDDGPWQNYASALALTFFFYHMDGDGKGTDIIEYFRAVGASPADTWSPDQALVEKYLLRGRSHPELQRAVQQQMRRLNVQVEFEDE